MAITFDMGTASVSVSAAEFTFPSVEATLDGVKFEKDYKNSVIETKHGRLTASGTDNLYDFAALTGGQFEFKDTANASVKSFDGSAATSKITFDLNSTTNGKLTKVTTGAGNDTVKVTSVTDGVLELGAGNDTIDIVAGTASVTLGTGADVVKVANTGATVTVTDYNYAEGDKFDFAGTGFNFDYGTATATLSNTGGSAVSVVTAMNNGVYELKNQDTHSHYVRTDVSSVDYVATEAIDFQSSADTTTLNLTLAGKNADTNTVSVGATEGTVNIVAGKAKANIAVGADVEFGLGISKKGSVVAVNSALDADDTLYLKDGGKIADVKFDGTANKLNYGTTTVQGALVAAGAAESKFKYDVNGEKGVLAYATVSTGAVTYAEDVTYYANAATVDATESGDVVLNLNGVCGNAFADSVKEIKGVTSGLVAGRDKTDNTIGIKTESGKKTEVYGGVAGNDSIDLNGDEDAINVIWYSNGDGKDTVTGFNKAEDSVYFHDAAAAASILNDVTKVVNGDLTVSMDKSNVLTLKNVVDTTETKVINFNDVAGNNFKVAVGNNTDVEYTSGVNIYKNAKTLKVEGEDELVIYTGANNDQYGYYDKTITTIDATGATGIVYLSGTNTNGMEIKGGDGVNNMWGGGDQVQTLTGGDGVNVFWFGNGDGRDTAKNAKAEDGVNLYNVEKIDDVVVKTSTNYFTVNVGSNSLKVDLGTTKADEALKTFTFADKAGVQYTYDTKTNKFQQK
ncbi:MAG: hypothetical protein PUJ23_08090 [Veillonellaceae bacterium]|nr:hypothetical protein [Veillonellaceae bacterium]